MSAFENLKIWQQGLGLHQPDGFEKDQERLRVSFEALRSRSTDLGSTIADTHPTLTVHDITHIDALWSMAQMIVGEEAFSGTTPYLNPLETFVLGAAFLVHDLGYSRRALTLTDSELCSDVDYQDILASVSRARHGERYDQADGTAPDEEDEKEALALYLSAKHADLAMMLPLRSWSGSDGQPQFLLSDPEIRVALGEAIGKVAASHQWQVGRLPEEFGIMGSPAFLPPNWNCDLLRLACIVRLADAAQIDARRAPVFLAALKRPTSLSKMHWDFQQKLHQPVRLGDRLQYTSGSSFGLEQADAWWLCYDTLNMIDHELSEVDSMLADAARHRFAVRSVAGVEDPRRLSKLIPTSGWRPVDTQIRVGDVASLVSRLGGKQLYGNNGLAPLRELVQNAGDAVRARRLLEQREDSWGSVDISLFERDGTWRLRVADTGTGMSEAVLTGALLDFGSSFWRSSEASKEFPGLKSLGFQATGRYGIGFFSAFMLGSHVKIVSRRYDLGMNDTRVLEFRDGVYSRPVLRAADALERKVCGTQVEITLDRAPHEVGGLLRTQSHEIPRLPLKEMVAWLCPSFEVDLRVSEAGEPLTLVLEASDWCSIPSDMLLARLEKVDGGDELSASRIRQRCAPLMRPLFLSDGSLGGRAALRLEFYDERHMYRDEGVITVGGSRSQAVHAISGLVKGSSLRASRDRGEPLVDEVEFLRWAEEQRELLIHSDVPDEAKVSAAASLRAIGVDPGDLPICRCRDGWLSRKAVIERARRLNRINLVDHIFQFDRSVAFDSMLDDVIVVDSGVYSGGLPDLSFLSHRTAWEWNGSDFHMESLKGLVIESVAEGWSVAILDMLAISKESGDSQDFEVVIGPDKFGNPVTKGGADILIRPGCVVSD